MGCVQSKRRDAPQSLRIVNNDSTQNPGSIEVDGSIQAKVVLLGDSGVGKSSVALRYCQGRFANVHEVTIGAAFFQQNFRLSDNTEVKLHIWDTGGQDRFRAMAPLYYRDAAGAILTFDCINKDSFDAIRYWVGQLQLNGPPDCQLIVVANKTDMVYLDGDEFAVPPDVVREYCDSIGAIYAECSAKTGENVPQVFERLAERIRDSKRAKITTKPIRR